MKTAEEWVKDLHGTSSSDIFLITKRHIKQIQLDAMKEGMKRAAEMISSCPSACECSQSVGWKESEQSILTASEQLTQKDLQ